MPDETPSSPLTRRQALGLIATAGITGTGAVLGQRVLARGADDASSSGPAELMPWSDPSTWDQAMPTEADEVIVSRPVLLDRDVSVFGMRIEPAGELVLHPDHSVTLTSTGNIEVHGALRLRPRSPGVQHEVQFQQVDEAAYTGGHTDQVLTEDVGLWVLGQGALDLIGTPKRAWTRLTSPALPGTMLLGVEDAEGWQVGDQIVVTPTESSQVPEYWAHHDTRTITAIAGNQVALDQPLAHPHPAVTVRDGVTFHPEVLNISRNVRISGTPEGRAHVMLLRTATPQHMSHAELRHLGPRQGEDAVSGRYPLHLHLCEDGSRGSTLEGMVARECGNHAFTIHMSHGVTVRECVSHDTFEDPYWWDPVAEEEHADGSMPSHDVLYERCVAHRVKTGRETRYLTTGFFLGAGRGNAARGCVAVGVEGDAPSASGFHWPERSNDGNIWVFEDNLAHNLERSGIYYWQNAVPRTIVDRFTAYHCATGVYAGAYSNLASYRDCTTYACAEKGMLIAAVPDEPERHPGETITYERVYVDQAGMSDFAVEFAPPVVESGRPVQITDCTFKGGTVAQLGFPAEEERLDEALTRVFELVGCRFEGNEFWLHQRISPNLQVRLVHDLLGDLLLKPVELTGELRRRWNARISRLRLRQPG